MITKILLAYDGSENSRRALDVASELSKKLEADLSIVHVLMHGRPPEELVRMAEVENIIKDMHQTLSFDLAYTTGRAFDFLSLQESNGRIARVISAVGEKLVAYAKARAEDLGARSVSASVRQGDYADKIIEAANEQETDLIVIGSRGLGTITATVLGSVSQKVLHHADKTVVTVR